MSKSIKLSKEHGVNPTIPICFWCEKDKNEVALLGKLPGDAEAPMRMWIPGDYEPCEECKKMWDDGIALVEAYENPVLNENQPPFHGAYPTGRLIILSEEGVKKIFMPEMAKTLLEKRMGFMNHETIDALNEIFCKMTNGDENE